MRRRRNQIREKERIKGIHINKTHDLFYNVTQINVMLVSHHLLLTILSFFLS